MDPKGKKAVVVGGASGMARASAELLRERGADIAILDLPSSKGAEVAAGLGGSFHPVDVTDDAGVESALAGAAEALGGMHIAVNTAGGGIAKRTLGKQGPHPIEEFRQVVELNLVATFNLNRLQGPVHVPERAGRRRARRDDQHGLDRRLRGPDRPGGLHRRQGRHRRHGAHHGRDLGMLGIRVMAIAPSLFKTGLITGANPEMEAALTKDAASPSGWGAPRSTRGSPWQSSRTPCSTAAPSAWTAASASRRAETAQL